jgi:phosphatidylserine/phosphatidylglycerophosphate/cardiolipin synthase-like enzyme
MPNRRYRASFSPGDECLRHIISLIRSAEKSLDVCVFTITDDRIAKALVRAHERNLEIRIVTDDDKLNDAGSDIRYLADQGLSVRVDNTPFHMHHKFMLVDSRVLLTGSYNWTRSAGKGNHENLISMGEPYFVRRFQQEFEILWNRCQVFL